MLQTQTPIYNSRLILGYVEYLRRYYPQVDCAKLLDYAGMTIFEVEDPAHWFTQEQVDRFHHILEEKTGAADISREAGRYMSRAENMGPTRQLALGLMTVKSLFWMLEKLSPLLTRGA